MTDPRLLQIQRKRARLQEELLLRRQIAELDDEEDQLLTLPPIPHGLPNLINLSDSPEPEQVIPDAKMKRESSLDEARIEQAANTPKVMQDQTAPAIRAKKRSPRATFAKTPLGDLEAYKTVVPSNDGTGYVELRCHLCGANCRRHDKKFFRGLSGFQTHIRYMHPDHYANISFVDVVEKSFHHRLTAEEVAAATRGDIQAYSIPRVPGDRSKLNKSCHIARPKKRATEEGTGGRADSDDGQKAA